jgi:hypothetical protein
MKLLSSRSYLYPPVIPLSHIPVTTQYPAVPHSLLFLHSEYHTSVKRRQSYRYGCVYLYVHVGFLDRRGDKKILKLASFRGGQGCAIGTVTRLPAGRSGVRILVGSRHSSLSVSLSLSLSKTSKHVLGLTKPPTEWILEFFHWGYAVGA